MAGWRERLRTERRREMRASIRILKRREERTELRLRVLEVREGDLTHYGGVTEHEPRDGLLLLVEKDHWLVVCFEWAHFII